MRPRVGLLAPVLVALPAVAMAGDYLGMLSLPRDSLPAPGELYSFASVPPPTLAGAAPVERPIQLKLGYRYSRYFSVEGELNDAPRLAASPFGAAESAAGLFHSSGFGVDTVATLPMWGFSFYGKMGAYHGEPRYDFASYSTSLLGDAAQGTRWRYGLGVRYDFTNSLGVGAEVERYSPLGTPLARDTDSDLFSIGVRWRF